MKNKKSIPIIWLAALILAIWFVGHGLGLLIKNNWFNLVITVISISISIFILSKRLWSKLNEEAADGDTALLPWIFACGIIMISDVVIFNDMIFQLINSDIIIDSSSYNYLLSAINQSLATLFALIFSLMFILTQLSKGSRANSSQVSKIFTDYLLLYIISFVVAIVAPLCLMGTKQIVGVKIVLFMAICNVAMLIPFFWRFKITTARKKLWMTYL